MSSSIFLHKKRPDFLVIFGNKFHSAYCDGALSAPLTLKNLGTGFRNYNIVCDDKSDSCSGSESMDTSNNDNELFMKPLKSNKNILIFYFMNKSFKKIIILISLITSVITVTILTDII